MYERCYRVLYAAGVGRLAIVSFLAMGLFLGCSKKSDDDSPSGTSIGLNFINSGKTQAGFGIYLTDPGSYGSYGLADDNKPANLKIGANTVSQLQSLQYAIGQIRLCKTMSISGTAISKSEGCSTLYASGQWSESVYGESKVGEGTEWVDIMDQAAAKTTIAKNSVPLLNGEYNYGEIQHYKPVKVKASVTLSDGRTLSTKSATTQKTSSPDNSKYFEASSLEGTAELSEIVLNSGGSFFKFQKPFIFNGEGKLVMDLVFNPDSYVTASTSGTFVIRGPDQGKDAAGYPKQDGINVPAARFTPIVHLNTDTTMKEVYLFSVPVANVRLEIYYLSSDETKAIMGIDTAAIPTTATDRNIGSPHIMTITQSGDAYEFKDWANYTVFKNFKRLTKAGDSGTATIDCGTGPGGASQVSAKGICGAQTGEKTVSYVLMEVRAVDPSSSVVLSTCENANPPCQKPAAPAK
ncbi:MAG: hypothetical protein HQK54_06285 [Oligoflexales bacterium]|nr:hypothetical protein [Oligoflexales bacterium]